MKRQWACVLAALVFLAGLPSAQAKWAWTPWGGWFKPSEVARGLPEDQFRYASDLMKAERYLEAAAEFEKLVENYAYSKYAPESQFMAGEAYQKGGELYAAFMAYEKLLADFAETPKVQPALQREYEIGDAFCAGARRTLMGYAVLPGGQAGVQVLNRVIEHDPYSELAEQALMRLGQYYLDSQQYAKAAETYSRILEEYPGSKHFADARYRKALASYKQIEGPYYDLRPMNQALDQLEDIKATEGAPVQDVPQLIESVHRTRAKADYDTARFYLRNGKVKAARVYLKSIVNRYPDTQYARMAQQVLQALPSEEGEAQ